MSEETLQQIVARLRMRNLTFNKWQTIKPEMMLAHADIGSFRYCAMHIWRQHISGLHRNGLLLGVDSQRYGSRFGAFYDYEFGIWYRPTDTLQGVTDAMSVALSAEPAQQEFVSRRLLRLMEQYGSAKYATAAALSGEGIDGGVIGYGEWV